MRADSLRDTIGRITDAKLRTAARAEAVREYVIEAKPAQGAWATERKGLSLIFDRDPELIRNKAGEVIGVDATVRAFRAGSEVKIDPHRVFINPPLLVPDGGVEVTRDGERPTYREDPHAAYLDVLFDSIERHPNAKGWRTRGTVTTIFSATTDGRLASENATYSTARSGGSLTSNTGSSPITFGQQFGGGIYSLYELFFAFDTSGLAGEVVDAVDLALYPTTDNSTQDFTLEARLSNWGPTLTTADWIAGASAGALTRVATLNTSGITTSAYNSFTEDGTNFQSGIDTGGTTYIIVVSSRFVSGNAPVSGNETVTVAMAEASGTSTDPKITVTHHTLAPEITAGPTVAYVDGFTGASALATPATVTFTATDSFFTDPDDLTFQIRTATGGGGTLVTSGLATSGISRVANVDYDDSGLVDGSQTLYLLVSNGSGSDEESFTFNRQVAFQTQADIRFGVGGIFEKTADLRFGVGGAFRKSIDIRFEVAPSPLRVTYALTGEFGPVVASQRYERRTKTNLFLQDVTTAIQRCRINANNNRPGVFRVANFTIDPREATINPLSDHIAVFTDLTVDGNYVLPLQWGLFALTHPSKTYTPDAAGGNFEAWEVGANDNSIHLLEDGPGEPYTVASGTNYFTAIATILTALGLPHALPSTSLTLPAAKVFPSDATWRDICNELTDGANHYIIKPDVTGTFRTRERTDLATRTPDVTYTDRDWLLIPVTLEAETTRFANKVIVTCNNPLLSSVAVNSDPDSPISTVNLGRVIARRIAVEAVADQTTLDAIAAQYLRDAASLYERLRIATQPDPRREANEVYAITIEELYDGTKFAVQEWEVELSASPNPIQTHTVSRVASAVVS